MKGIIGNWLGELLSNIENLCKYMLHWYVSSKKHKIYNEFQMILILFFICHPFLGYWIKFLNIYIYKFIQEKNPCQRVMKRTFQNDQNLIVYHFPKLLMDTIFYSFMYFSQFIQVSLNLIWIRIGFEWQIFKSNLDTINRWEREGSQCWHDVTKVGIQDFGKKTIF